MRFYLGLLIVAIILQGCCSCKVVDDFGMCKECDKCSRKLSVSAKWKAKVPEIAPFDCASMEKIDMIFLWEDIYNLLVEARETYLKRVKDAPNWIKSYAICKTSKTSWDNYWKVVLENGIAITKIKIALIERLGYLANQNETINPDYVDRIMQMISHFEDNFQMHTQAFTTIIKKIQKALPKVDYMALEKKQKKLVEVTNIAIKERLGSITMGSDDVIEALKDIIKKLNEVPRKKEKKKVRKVRTIKDKKTKVEPAIQKEEQPEMGPNPRRKRKRSRR